MDPTDFTPDPYNQHTYSLYSSDAMTYFTNDYPIGPNSEIQTNHQIEVTVKIPTKQPDPNQTTYEIDFKIPQQYKCIRKYNEFVWLYDRLCDDNKLCLVPSLPEKTTGWSQDEDTSSESRRRELERFLLRVVRHKKLKQSSHFKTFIESKEPLMEPPPNTTTQAISSFAWSWSANVASMFGMKLPTAIPSVLPPPKEEDSWFAEKKISLNNLETILQAYANNINTLRLRHKAMGEHFTTVAIQIEEISKNDHTYVSEQLEHTYDTFRLTSITLNALLIDLADKVKYTLEDDVHDHLRMIGNIRSLMNYRTEKLASYKNAESELEIKKEAFSRGKQMGMAELSNLEAEIDELKNTLEREKENYDNANRTARNEILEFEAAKAVEIQKAIIDFAKANLHFEEKTAELWKTFLSSSVP